MATLHATPFRVGAASWLVPVRAAIVSLLGAGVLFVLMAIDMSVGDFPIPVRDVMAEAESIWRVEGPAEPVVDATLLSVADTDAPATVTSIHAHDHPVSDRPHDERAEPGPDHEHEYDEPELDRGPGHTHPSDHRHPPDPDHPRA